MQDYLLSIPSTLRLTGNRVRQGTRVFTSDPGRLADARVSPHGIRSQPVDDGGPPVTALPRKWWPKWPIAKQANSNVRLRLTLRMQRGGPLLSKGWCLVGPVGGPGFEPSPRHEVDWAPGPRSPDKGCPVVIGNLGRKRGPNGLAEAPPCLRKRLRTGGRHRVRAELPPPELAPISPLGSQEQTEPGSVCRSSVEALSEDLRHDLREGRQRELAGMKRRG